MTLLSDGVDLREQLVNLGEIGPIGQVSIPETMITSVRGIMLDVDPRLFRDEYLAGPDADPAEFFGRVVAPQLDGHPVLAGAEVRVSGVGLHVIVRLDPAVEITTEGERQRWGGVVKAVQRVLPTDPDCPGITAMTRPLGSINSKNGTAVRLLREGRPVDPGAVLALYEEVRARPFRVVSRVLLGSERVEPCPVCKRDGSRLDALDAHGKCYGSCGKVRLAAVYDLFLRPRPATVKS